MTEDPLDLVGKLDEEEVVEWRHHLDCVSPNDAKYWKDTKVLKDQLSCAAEWMACAKVQRDFLEARVQMGKAEQWNLDEVDAALEKIDPLNMKLIEDNVTRHDQLAVIEEIGRYVSPETKALLHPGTTSYDILDTARAYLFRQAWYETIRPKVIETIEKLCKLAEDTIDVMQVGRTHLQSTSPVLFANSPARTAARLAESMQECDRYFGNLKGKLSGMVGTGAGPSMICSDAMTFEIAALAKLDLLPDYTATQITARESLLRVGQGLHVLTKTLGVFANNIRQLYSTAIGEVTSSDSEKTRALSSTDAFKNNPIHWENIRGKAVSVESGLVILRDMVNTDHERDLCNSVQGRYQPQNMMVETYEMFCRASKRLDVLALNMDRLEENLQYVRKKPAEAIVTILRGEGWVHSEYGTGHNFVKKMGIRTIQEKRPLLEVALEDAEFQTVYDSLPDEKQRILQGELELYLGSAARRAEINIAYAKEIIKIEPNR
jgi:adenylosuccinate lyase